MKVAAIIEYKGDQDEIRASHEVHRQYLRQS